MSNGTVKRFMRALVVDRSNAEFVSFGRSITRYLQQVTNFPTFLRGGHTIPS